MTEEEPPADISIRGRGQSVVTYRAGGREYPLKTVIRCNVCMSPLRFEIERDIVAGRTYRRIADELTERGEQYSISTRSLSDHYTHGHMPLELTDTRSIVEARARQVGKDIENGQEQLVDGITLLNTVIMKTFTAIADGRIEPGVRDGIRAAKMLSDLGEYDGNSVDQQAFVQAFLVYHETAEQMMDPEEFKRFGKMLDENPVLKALAARYDGEPGETVPGEVTERQDEPAEETRGDA